MNLEKIEKTINEAFEKKDKIDSSDKTLNDLVRETIDLLDNGKIRVAEKKGDKWQVNQWIKKAILLSFRVNKMKASKGPYSTWYDKVDGKTQGWSEEQVKKAGFRYVPNGVIRKGAHIAKNVVLMPSFINVGAYVDEGTMIDTWASVGSNPTIVEDDCFLGARAEIAEGVIVEKGSVLSMGVYIGASTRIIDRATGKIHYGKVPAYSVVVPGSMPSTNNPKGPSLYCVVIVKKVDEKTRSKTSINDLLRD